MKGADNKLNGTHRKLRGKIVEKFGTIEEFAKAIKCSRQIVSGKLNDKVGMSRSDMEVWRVALDIPESQVYEYFF